MKRKYSIAVTVLSLCIVLTGCGRTKVNVNDYLTVNYTGYDTVGTASSSFDIDRMIQENPSAFGLKGDVSEMDLLGIEMQISDSFKGKLDKTSNLSNGDSITYQWNISNEESLKEKYPVNFSHEDTSYTITGLEQAEEFDPFENIEITFSGTAPNGAVKIDTSKAELSGLIYTADKTSELKNGDVITITVSASGSSGSGNYSNSIDESEIYGYDIDDEGYEGYYDSNGDFHRLEDENNNNNNTIDDGLKSYCMKNGKIPTVSEKEYTVEGLTSYAMTIDEIPQDMQEKMKNQVNDSIQAKTASWASEERSLKESKFLGYYFLTAKEGFSTKTYNIIDCVYKITVDITGYTNESLNDKVHGEESYYTIYRYTNAMILPDGTCSINLSEVKAPEHTIKSDFGYDSFFGKEAYKYTGYKDLDSMFNDYVTANIEKYDYVSTVAE